MKMNEYQDLARTTAAYPRQTIMDGVIYNTLGLCGEAGEVANKVKKIIRDNNGILSSDVRDKIIDECGDCLWYLSQLAYELGINLDHLAHLNLTKLQERKRANTIHGDSREKTPKETTTFGSLAGGTRYVDRVHNNNWNQDEPNLDEKDHQT